MIIRYAPLHMPLEQATVEVKPEFKVVLYAEHEAVVDRAKFEGALAMAHYYHGDYAGDEFKENHAKRALRPEHGKWAKDYMDKMLADLATLRQENAEAAKLQERTMYHVDELALKLNAESERVRRLTEAIEEFLPIDYEYEKCPNIYGLPEGNVCGECQTCIRNHFLSALTTPASQEHVSFPQRSLTADEEAIHKDTLVELMDQPQVRKD